MSVPGAFTGAVTKVIESLTGPAAGTLATLPLFVFMGYVMAEAKTASRLVRAANAWFGWAPGGLAIVTVLTCAFFTTVTGASGVTIVAIGGLLLPELLKQQYKEKFALGLVTGTGSVGLLFPPALPLIVYGIVYGISAQALADTGAGGEMQLAQFDIEAFYYSGIFPGILLVATVCLYAIFKAIRDKVPRAAPEVGASLGKVTLVALPELLIPILLMVSLAKGILLIPEAAALTAVYVIVLEVGVFRDVKITQLWKIVRESMTLVGAIFIIIVASTALTQWFVDADVPNELYKGMRTFIGNKWTFLLALNLLLLIVGCLMDIFSAIVIVVPLIAPAAKQYGIDPYHLGVIFLLNLEIGYLTPPVGLNLFITSFRFRKPMVDVYRAAFPFLGVMLAVLLIVSYVPLLWPKTVGLMHIAVKERKSLDMGGGGAGGGPTQPGVDAGVAAQIPWNDGGVWTPARCETPEIKDDPLAYAECTAMFKLYPKCMSLPTELDRLECQDKVKAGEDPFTATPDAGPE
jgi:tripartite ATP-independent transporter DctM subunit